MTASYASISFLLLRSFLALVGTRSVEKQSGIVVFRNGSEASQNKRAVVIERLVFGFGHLDGFAEQFLSRRLVLHQFTDLARDGILTCDIVEL